MAVLLVGLVLSVLVVLLVHYFLTCRFSYWHDRGVPHLTPELLFGNIREWTLFRCTQAEVLKFLYDSFPGERYAGMFQWRSPAFLVRDPELVKHVLLKDFSHFHDRGMLYDELRDPLTAHLISLEGERWKSLRSKLSPAFTSGRLKAMLPLVEECSRDMMCHLNCTEGPVDVRETLARFTTDVIGTCAFGLKFDALTDPNSQFRKMGRRIMAPSYSSTLRRTARFIFPAITKAIGLRQFPQDMTDFFCNVVRDALNLRRGSGRQQNDFLQLLLHLQQNQGDTLALSDTVLAAQVFVFFLAGFETSSSTMTFCLYELAHQPAIQRRLREEVRTALRGSKNGEFSYEDIQGLTYMDKVLAETLRMYPSAAMLFRSCTREYEVPDSSLRLESGLQVIVPVYALHHDPEYYPKPSHFDPERFSEQAKAARHPFVYLPFGEGPRICIGQRFAFLEMKLGLAHLLHNYEVLPCAETVPIIKLDPRVFVLQSANTIYLKFVRCQSTEDSA